MRNSKLRKVLIANRGEIALRIDRACTKLGIETLFIASEADKNSYFARTAKNLVLIGPAAAKDSYLSIDKIISAALENKCDGIHPGYGFLSENSEFARRVEEAGITFIGPSSKSIEALGSKTEARKRVQERGVPTTRGSLGGLSDKELLREALAIGFPLIIKAVGGGGGRGMRIVNSAEEMEASLPLARAEAKKNFSNEAVYFEQYIREPRHVEVQVFGDHHGNVVHFGTRDCSTQRRHQKLVEEAPAPFLHEELRHKIETAAVEAARSVGYQNAGTAEFLVKGDKFYFLEMNTRIQVEHPVSEVVTGVDLVELQLRVAQGEPLPFSQKEIRTEGHAIEFRIYAEDPYKNFSPAKGRISRLKRPQADYIREDFAFEEGDEVSLFYDAMMSKLIIFGKDRQEAIERSYEALRQYELEGISTTIPFHRWLLRNSPFRTSPLDIGYLQRHFSEQSLKDLEAGEILDPRHRAPVAGAENCESLLYYSKKFQQTLNLLITHKANGLFMASPVDEEGKSADPRFCRLSNGYQTAVRSVVEEVLEVVPPADLFGIS